MPKTLRTFIALPLNTTLKQVIAKTQEELKKTGAHIKWVSPPNLHLTLKFLGPTPLEKIDLIKAILNEIANQQKPFSITITKLGAFPRISTPQVIWLGIEEGASAVSRLADACEKALADLGFPKEKRVFHPHLTIGRKKGPQNLYQLTKCIKNFSLSSPLQQTISSIAFIKSTLTPQGPIYENIAKFTLGGQ